MHIALVTTGTEGDVRPFVAIGKGLERAGYRVTVAANPDHRDLVTSHGLAFRPVGMDMKAVLESDAGREWLESSDSPRRYVAAFKRAFDTAYPAFLEDVHTALLDLDPGAVLYQPFAFGAQFTAELRGIPAVCLSPFPHPASAAFDPLLLLWPSAPAWPALRQWLRGAILRAMWSALGEPHERHRARLGLAPFRTKNPILETIGRGPLLHLFSASFAPMPSDCGPHVHATGYCFLDTAGGWTPPRELIDFLGAGAPPIYVGFGSMTGRDPEGLARLAIEAVSSAKQRAVLVSGWSGMAKTAALPGHVFAMDSVPHDWLFPRVSAVVHHGGAGTTAAGLRAGKPTLVTAFFGDQPFWGALVARAGAGPKPILRRRLNAVRLADAITQTLNGQEYRRGAERMAEALRSEDGVANAVKFVERYVVTGRATAQHTLSLA
jgi:sterol 3beta-glucosyltransferase